MFRDGNSGTGYFDPVLFIGDGVEVRLPDTNHFPYFYNNNGQREHRETPKGTLITVEEDTSISLGQQYLNITHQPKTIPTETGSYVITEFDFHATGDVIYKPMWATRETVRAFGITLVRNEECVLFDAPGLVGCQYVYGKFASYQSLYIGAGRIRELLTVNATDLEYHMFAHIFCSQDSLPLVISVARWRPQQAMIHLADLWVRPGDCLYVPAKVFSPVCCDLHGNRNSARACWGVDGRVDLVTETVLGNPDMFAADLTKPYYHEEKTNTVHTFPLGFS